MPPRFRCFVQQIDKELPLPNTGYCLFLRYDCGKLCFEDERITGKTANDSEIFSVVIGKDTDLVIVYDDEQGKAVFKPRKIKR